MLSHQYIAITAIKVQNNLKDMPIHLIEHYLSVLSILYQSINNLYAILNTISLNQKDNLVDNLINHKPKLKLIMNYTKDWKKTRLIC
jgi:hypothetical protein